MTIKPSVPPVIGVEADTMLTMMDRNDICVWGAYAWMTDEV